MTEKQKKYRVRVYVKSYTVLEVLAPGEEEAKQKAWEQCRYGYREYSGKEFVSAEITASGPADEPLVLMPTEWDIYSSMPGHRVANQEISDAVRVVAEKLLHESREGADIGPKLVKRLVKEHISPIFKKHRKYGTYDTEPRGAVAHYLAMYADALECGDDEEIYDAVQSGL